jgi:hypothetical protein
MGYVHNSRNQSGLEECNTTLIKKDLRFNVSSDFESFAWPQKLSVHPSLEKEESP